MDRIIVNGNGKGVNATPLWYDALEKALETNAGGVHFNSGEWHFYSEGCVEKYRFVSNNDYGLHRIIFALDGVNDFAITADDAKFIFHGKVTPFFLEKCRNISLSGFSIDFAENFAEDAELISCDGENSWLSVGGAWQVKNGKLRFFDDPSDNMHGFFRLCAFEVPGGDLRPSGGGFALPNKVLAHEGNRVLLPGAIDDGSRYFCLRHQERLNPGIIIDRCAGVRVADVIVHHAEGMGVIGQNSADILLERVKVVPNGTRNVAVTDDALHFSECSGKIEVKDCVMHRTIDDALNIHGIYRKLRKNFGVYMLECAHFQQNGIFADQAGDEVELVDPHTMRSYARMTIKSIDYGTCQHAMVSFEEEMPPEFKDGDSIRNLKSGNLEVSVSGCNICNNRPRGILLTGVQKGIISGNHIHSPGAGVYISGDAGFWFESGPDKHVEICNNVFDHCKYKVNSTGTAPIAVAPEVREFANGFYYHDFLDVHDNLFRETSLRQVLHARSLAELRFTGNTVEVDEAVDSTAAAATLVKTEHCGNVTEKDNLIRNA